MSNRQDFIDAINHRTTQQHVPLWELHFHLWKKFSQDRFVSGKDFLALGENEKQYAISSDAEIMVEIGEKLHFGGVSIPDMPWDCIYTLPQEYRVQLVSELKKRNPDFNVIAGAGGVLSMPSGSEGYEEFCYRLFDEPEQIDEKCETMFHNSLKVIDSLIDAGIDGFYIPADVADNRAPFFNGEQLERWYYPYLKKTVAYMKQKGKFAILHTDGNINTLLDNLLATGIDGLQAIDPVAGMDIVKVHEAWKGKACVCGNLDCGLMLNGTPDAVYEAAVQLLRSCKDGGDFIMGNSNAVAYETPVENYQAMIRAWEDYSSYNH